MLASIDEHLMAEAFVSTPDPEASDSGCPSPDELWMTCTGELDLEKRLEIIDHCSTCSLCAAAMSRTRELVAQWGEESEDSGERGREQDSGFCGISPAALALAESPVACPEELLRKIDGVSEEPAANQGEASEQAEAPARWRKIFQRSTAGMAVLASVALLALYVSKKKPERSRGNWRESPAAGAANPGGANYRFSGGEFYWPAQPGAEHYELEIASAGAKPLCKLLVFENRHVMDAVKCPGYIPGEAFYWRVRSVASDGRESVSSYFSVSPESSRAESPAL